MKHYDYKDETKDVRGKVNSLSNIAQINQFLIDWKAECNQRIAVNAERSEKCGNFDYS